MSGLFGSLFGSPSSSSSSTQVADFQQPYLEQLFREAQAAYGTAQDQGPYTGALYAGINDAQREGIDTATSFARGAGQDIPEQAVGAAADALRYGGATGQNAQGIFNRLNGDIAGDAQTRAAAYATGADADALVDAANRDATRNLTENQLPALTADAAATGNRGSSRTGVESAILQRGAADRMADTSAQIRQDLYDRSLGASLDAENLRTNGQVAANSQLGGLLTTGFGGASSAINNAGALSDLFLGAGAVAQQDQQAQLDERRAMYDLSRYDNFDLLGRYSSILGSPIMTSSTQSVGADPGAIKRVSDGVRNIGNIGATVSGWSL